jgi:hypothetical protein
MLAGVEASIDGPSLFTGFAGTCCGGGGSRRELPLGGGQLPRERGDRGQVIAAKAM